MEDTPLVMIQDAESLNKALEVLATEPVIGVDTEADSMHHYREKVCLIQISDRTRDYIVDPLAGFSLDPLADLMADKGVVKIFHGADYDVVSLKRDFGFEIRNIFDTMISAQFLELPRVGLADLCNEYFGFYMDKKYQTHDWASRPLLPEHLDYARGDTHFLLAIRELFVRKLDRKGRLDIVTEEFELLESRSWKPRSTPEAAFLRVKGATRLSPQEQRVLRALWHMRDRHAERLDRPPYKVVPDQVLLKLAQAQPPTMDDLVKHVRPRSSMVKRFGDDLVEAVNVGLADDAEIPEPPKKQRTGTRPRYGAREAERLFTRLKTWRSNLVNKRKMPMVMVASNAQLKAIAGYRPANLEELAAMEEVRSWQASLHGEDLMRVIKEFEEGGGGRSASSGGEGASKKKSSQRRRRRRKREGSAQA